DVLINNAGINIRKPVHELTLGEWRQVIDTNLTSAYLCCHAAYPLFKAAGGGKIINIGSMMSIFGASYAPAYAASKGGIVQLTKSLAIAWAGDNIQVNAVLPGWIDTDLTRGARQQVPTLNENVLRRTPAKRWGEIGGDDAGFFAQLADRRLRRRLARLDAAAWRRPVAAPGERPVLEVKAEQQNALLGVDDQQSRCKALAQRRWFGSIFRRHGRLR